MEEAPDHGSEHAEAVPSLDELHGYIEALSWLECTEHTYEHFTDPYNIKNINEKN